MTKYEPGDIISGYGSHPKRGTSMIKVQSSNIEAVDHDGQHLTVQFKSGATWTYHDVPEPVFRKMLSADSIGGYFAKHVRNGYKGAKHE